MPNSFNALTTFKVDDLSFRMYKLGALKAAGLDVSHLPFSLKILLENLLRNEDGTTVTADDIESLAKWDPKAIPSREIAFRPSRVLLQDFTGVPAVVDLAAMRDAMKRMGGDPKKINPLQPVELVIDHSVQVDEAGTARAFLTNAELEFQRNRERYAFLRWGQNGFKNFRVVPPDTGIVHQVNVEYLARVVFSTDDVDTLETTGAALTYPDTLVGTDSHTTMINGLGVLGWGVGGIEAEAAMLGQPVSMLVPQVIGFKFTGSLPEGATATDLVLTVTEMLRRKGVVGKFVEYYGEGLANLPLADRATIANMAPEYGATCGIFPVDAETLRYLELSGRPAPLIRLVETYCREQGLFHEPGTPEAVYSDTLELDLATVEPSLAGPKRPQDRVPLKNAKAGWQTALNQMLESRPASTKAKAATSSPTADHKSESRLEGEGGGGMAVGVEDPTAPAAAYSPLRGGYITNGSVVIAAITSCTNTSNPSVMVAAGLLAKKAVERHLSTKPWVKASLAPGSKVVTDYLHDAGLDVYLDKLRFNLVGYGCTTCIGNSGPLSLEISKAIHDDDLVTASVLSGNRNFEGRINSEVRANYLASPPLVVAYALAGTMDIDLVTEPIGDDQDGKPVYLKDIWPTQREVQDTILKSVRSDMFRKQYGEVFQGDEQWNSLPIPQGDLYEWDDSSTYVKNPPYFVGMPDQPAPITEIKGARALAVLGDSITTDHISPAGSIKVQSPAGKYLMEHGVSVADFNSYGSRRGNHEVMVRGTFANVRLKNKLAPGTEGGFTRYLPDGEVTSIFEASERYQANGVPLVILAGKEYGSGSSRDWAAKGPKLLGVRVVIAESYERIHRSNLVGMGILPLQFGAGDNVEGLGLTGEEVFSIVGLAEGIANGFANGRDVTVVAERADGQTHQFTATVRIDTPQEIRYYEHGGILPYVLRQLLSGREEAPAAS
ncbi:aconitate hydratase AcnA [Singulisphaera acidiphila]|uniref:Aconitate hydratase n=1 Tax=Singulisphaera acidiphila (strain ATCC BAA-1392 / DSM 18658 / VKM B-2454 / MOB10) TaxID=886293 RepID=L0DPL8_SINAD|nr:aconitate hydratase AcnA [Singulisphaera acidiphila]AGA30626.1 aconitate hydratase 1 [Singulisphaera acidiphila DSM 18658]